MRFTDRPIPLLLMAFDSPDREAAQPLRLSDDPHAALAARAKAGDRAALRQLLTALTPGVDRLVAGILGPSHPDRDDAVQNALVGFVRALPAFRGDCPARCFMARIAARAATEARTRTRTRRGREEMLADEPAGDGDGPDREALGTRRRALWRELVARLPEAQAEVVTLRVLLDYSLEETAAAVDAPVNTVRSRMRLARESMLDHIRRDPRFAELREDA
jgi:RNA polymerase sigma factor (sigma-70 family)